MMSVRTVLFAWAVWALVFGCANATETLTLALEAPEVGAMPSSPPAKTPARQASVRSQETKVGRVGVVQIPSAGIYQRQSSGSRRYATVKAETPLAIVREEGDWLGVLMVNGATGWISRSAVKMTNYELVAQKPAVRRSEFTSRGGAVSRPTDLGQAIVQTALQYSDVRYVYGGNDPATGIDCSAFVKLVFSHYNIHLPRTGRQQAAVGATVPFDQLKPGDRLYFACKKPHIDHCGIYAGDGYFIHCSASRGGVAVDTLASDFYWRSLVVAKRS